MISRTAAKERKVSTEGTLLSSSRSEWFDKEPSAVVSYDDRKSRPGFTSSGGASSSDDWMLDETPEGHSRPYSTATSARLTRVSKKPTRETNQRRTNQDDWKNGTTTPISADSRKSILECDVNPYLLLKKQKDEDDLSDDLSDNALEQDDLRTRSSLFDSSKVKSIERIPNRNAVAAIGGQRIRVFNERPREISDDDDDVPLPVTRIPIPKVSPKRPPRRLKEARQTLKSILKRGRMIESKRKNVLFNVDNVIFAPEKPSEATRLSWSRIGRIVNCDKEQRDNSSEPKREEEETPIVPQEQQEKHNFITIPNIRDPKVDRIRYKEPKIVPEVKKTAPSGPDRIKIDKFVPSKKFDRFTAFKKQNKTGSEPQFSLDNSLSSSKIDPRQQERTLPEERRLPERTVRLEDETELEIEIEELKDRLPCIAVDEKDLILKSEGKVLLSYYEILKSILKQHFTINKTYTVRNVSFTCK